MRKALRVAIGRQLLLLECAFGNSRQRPPLEIMPLQYRLLAVERLSPHFRHAVGARSLRAFAPASTTVAVPSRRVGVGRGLPRHWATTCAARWFATKAPPASESPVVTVEYYEKVGSEVTQRVKVKLSPGGLLNVAFLEKKFGLTTVEELVGTEAVGIPFDPTTGDSRNPFHVQEGGVIWVTGARKEGGESRPCVFLSGTLTLLSRRVCCLTSASSRPRVVVRH